MEVAFGAQLEGRGTAGGGEADGGRADGADCLEEDDEQRRGEHCGGERNDKLARAARAVEADECVAHALVSGTLAQLNHGARDEAARKQQIGGAREVEVVVALEGPGEGEDGEVEGRDYRRDKEAEELDGSILGIDKEHQRGEEHLAAHIDDLPEEDARVVVAPEEAACAGKRGDALRAHLGADPKQEGEEGKRDEHRPEDEEGPKVGVEAAVLFVVGAAAHGEVGNEVATPLVVKSSTANDSHCSTLKMVRETEGSTR